MFDKFMGKKKKEADLFHVPQRKYTTDPKIIAKMGAKALQDLVSDQDKYISVLAEQIQHGRVEYERVNQKVDELLQKNEVVNAQVSRMTNEHQQLTIKFDNLQSSLQMFSTENEALYRKELKFLSDNEIPCEKIKNLTAVLTIYRQKLQLCKKIEQQNKNLKNKYSDLEETLEQAQAKLKQLQKQKSYNNLIPSLMQEIQQLRQRNDPKPSSEDQFSKLQQQILQKVKSEIETVSTIRSSQEEEDDKSKISSAELERLNQELHSAKVKEAESELKRQELQFNMANYQQKIEKIERQLSKSNNLVAVLKQKLQNLEEDYDELQKAYDYEHQRISDLQKKASQVGKLKEQLNILTLKIQKTNQLIVQNQKEISQKNEEILVLKQQVQGKEEELVHQRENRATFQHMLSDKNSSESDHLLKMKAKLEEDLQELRQTLQSTKKTLVEVQSKNKQLNEDCQQMKAVNRRVTQEKQVIQDNMNQCLKMAQNQSQRQRSIEKDLKKKNDELNKEIQVTNNKLKSCQQQIRNFGTQIDRLVRTIQGKESEIKKAYATLQQSQKEKNGLVNQLSDIEEDNKSRIRKYESELNQQRIKMEGLNRKLGNLQSKSQENKTSMDSMYEQLLAKDKKIAHMQIKLKEYKYMIQVLKKQKLDIQETYEAKLKNIDVTSPFQSKQATIVADARDEQTEQLRNELLSLKEQNVAILAENQNLRVRIQDLEEVVQNKERNIKLLQEKRDHIMKEIQKIGRKNSGTEISSHHQLPSPKLPPRIEPKQIIEQRESREKKIAAKAHKGFEILLKLQHQLYKNFINVFTKDLGREQVKNIEGEINSIIKRSNDMRDIFEDYL